MKTIQYLVFVRTVAKLSILDLDVADILTILWNDLAVSLNTLNLLAEFLDMAPLGSSDNLVFLLFWHSNSLRRQLFFYSFNLLSSSTLRNSLAISLYFLVMSSSIVMIIFPYSLLLFSASSSCFFFSIY